MPPPDRSQAEIFRQFRATIAREINLDLRRERKSKNFIFWPLLIIQKTKDLAKLTNMMFNEGNAGNWEQWFWQLQGKWPESSALKSGNIR
jgi:hypothetical protein